MFSHTLDPRLTLQPTPPYCSLMTASWAWICLTGDSERIFYSFFHATHVQTEDVSISSSCEAARRSRVLVHINSHSGCRNYKCVHVKVLENKQVLGLVRTGTCSFSADAQSESQLQICCFLLISALPMATCQTTRESQPPPFTLNRCLTNWM